MGGASSGSSAAQHHLQLAKSLCFSQIEGHMPGYRFSPGWYCGSVAVK